MVAPLEHHPKLVDVNELVSGDHEDPKSRGVIPEGEYPKLDFLSRSLKGLDGGLLFCYLKVGKMLEFALLGIKRAAFIVDEGGHLVQHAMRKVTRKIMSTPTIAVQVGPPVWW